MAIITAKVGTWAKSRPISSNYLHADEKIWAKKGDTLDCTAIAADKNQHHWVKIQSGRQCYVYSPHWSGLTRPEVKLPVLYSSQRDNWDKYHGPGWRQCNLTAHYMAADFLLKGEIREKALVKKYLEGEDLYGQILAKHGDTTDPQAHTPALREFGIDSYFSYTGSIKDLVLCIDKGVPVPIGVAYKASGHYVCAVGHRADGVYIHDPFGVRMGLSDNYENTSGAYDFVTWDWLQAKWVDQGSEAGWMRVITAVNGTPTGVPRGL